MKQEQSGIFCSHSSVAEDSSLQSSGIWRCVTG